uniref:DDE Tnp4 domain-containing protein n=2 Tax=Brassica TaxID=3705 RepID=A0A0D3EEG2_BRAOL
MAAIRVLAYGIAADTVDEYLRLGETTTRLCLENFVEGIINLFGDEYLRRPTSGDLQRLLDIGEHIGFSGMIGSIASMHWEWKNFSTAWKGQYSRATLNDINVLDHSHVFDDIIRGHALEVIYYVNGREYHMAYYLTTDCIYQKWATFIQSIPIPQGPKAVLFAQRQEAVRKDVNRAFGVLQARFAIVKNPAPFWDKVKIGKIMRACIILHNMIVEDKQDGYTQFDVSEFQQGEDHRSSHVDLTYSTDIPINIANMMDSRRRRSFDRSVSIKVTLKRLERLRRRLFFPLPVRGNHAWSDFGAHVSRDSPTQWHSQQEETSHCDIPGCSETASAFSDTAYVQCCCNGDERIIWFLIKFIVSLEFALDQVYFFCLSMIETLFSSSAEYLTKDASSPIDYINKDAFLAMAKRAKAELKGGTLKTVSDKGKEATLSLTGSEKAKPLKKTELVKKPLPKMKKTPGKSVVEVKERKGPCSRGSQEIKDHGHVKFLLPGFPGSSPKTKQSFPVHLFSWGLSKLKFIFPANQWNL